MGHLPQHIMCLLSFPGFFREVDFHQIPDDDSSDPSLLFDGHQGNSVL
jgi:hypothetical protein